MTPAEKRFKEMAHRKKWYVLRPSWPDFLCVDNGRLFAVEVKYGQDWASKSQRVTFDLLEEHGFPVFMWHLAFRHQFFPWQDVRCYWDGRSFKNRSLPRKARIKEWTA